MLAEARQAAVCRGPPAGRHLAKLTNDTPRRNDVANRLETLGCIVNRRGDGWMTERDFTR